MSRFKVWFFLAAVFALTFLIAAVSNAQQLLTVRLDNFSAGPSVKGTVTFPSNESLFFVAAVCSSDVPAKLQLQGNSTTTATATGVKLVPPQGSFTVGGGFETSFPTPLPIGNSLIISVMFDSSTTVGPSTCNVTLGVTP